MCVEHVWLFSDCRHSWQTKQHCADAKRAKEEAEDSGCCGLWASTPKKICQVRYETHRDLRACRQCLRAARDKTEREAREKTEARAQARRAAERYGWGDATRRDSHISSELYRQAVNIVPGSEYKRYMPPPPSYRPAASSPPRAVKTKIGVADVLPPLPLAVTRDQIRKGTGSLKNGSRRRYPQYMQPSQRDKNEIRDSYNGMIRSAGLPLPLPQQRHEASDENDEPLPDDDFLAMVGRAG